jgi:hypothetical protein
VEIEVFPVVVKFEGCQNIYGWCIGGDDNDYLITDGNNKLLAFRSIEELVGFDKEKYAVYEDQTAEYDFDAISKSRYYINNAVNCEELLNAWNLFGDIAHTTKLKFIGDSRLYNYEYEKLFCGCNLPSVVKEGRIYIPTWRSKEIRRLFKVVKNGIDIYVKSKY